MSGSTENAFNEEAVQTIVTLLSSNVPKSDVPNIKSELKTEFLLAKRKSKIQRNKPRKKKKQVLTRKEKKALGFFENAIPKSLVYKEFLPMNAVWLEYMNSVLDIQNKSIPVPTDKAWDTFTQSIYRADFHGSMMTVTRSKCPSYVGKTGICIMDTKNTFKLLSENNIVTAIPKKECVFQLLLKDMKIQIFGKHLGVRPAERTSKKVKGHLHPDL